MKKVLKAFGVVLVSVLLSFGTVFGSDVVNEKPEGEPYVVKNCEFVRDNFVAGHYYDAVSFVIAANFNLFVQANELYSTLTRVYEGTKVNIERKIEAQDFIIQGRLFRFEPYYQVKVLENTEAAPVWVASSAVKCEDKSKTPPVGKGEKINCSTDPRSEEELYGLN